MFRSAILLFVATSPAMAGSLDRLEVGGLEGTVAGTSPASVWWNPAMMSQSSGTGMLVEIGMTAGSQRIERDDPFNGGADTYATIAPLPSSARARTRASAASASASRCRSPTPRAAPAISDPRAAQGAPTCWTRSSWRPTWVSA